MDTVLGVWISGWRLPLCNACKSFTIASAGGVTNRCRDRALRHSINRLAVLQLAAVASSSAVLEQCRQIVRTELHAVFVRSAWNSAFLL